MFQIDSACRGSGEHVPRVPVLALAAAAAAAAAVLPLSPTLLLYGLPGLTCPLATGSALAQQPDEACGERDVLVYSTLLETTKPYLMHTMPVPALHALLPRMLNTGGP